VGQFYPKATVQGTLRTAAVQYVVLEKTAMFSRRKRVLSGWCDRAVRRRPGYRDMNLARTPRDLGKLDWHFQRKSAGSELKFTYKSLDTAFQKITTLMVYCPDKGQTATHIAYNIPNMMACPHSMSTSSSLWLDSLLDILPQVQIKYPNNYHGGTTQHPLHHGR
jgi:hypothetical protein